MPPMIPPTTPYIPQTPGFTDIGTPSSRAGLSRFSKSELVSNYITLLESVKDKQATGSVERFLAEQVISSIENESLIHLPDNRYENRLKYGKKSDIYQPDGRSYNFVVMFQKKPDGKLRPISAFMRRGDEHAPRIGVSYHQAANVTADDSTTSAQTSGRNAGNNMARSLRQQWENSQQQSAGEQSQLTAAERSLVTIAANVLAMEETWHEGTRMDIDSPPDIQDAQESTVTAPSSKTFSMQAAKRVSTAIISYVQGNFSSALENMLTVDLIDDDPTDIEKQNNTYYAVWILPPEKRFFGALIQTTYDACKYNSIEIIADNSHSLLEYAVRALRGMRPQEQKKINQCLENSHRLTNDSNKPLTMREALKNLPDRFTEMTGVNKIFQRVAERIMQINPARNIDPLRMWEHCVPRTMSEYMQELGVDTDNPFLPYFDDTAQKSSLLNMANSWDYVTQTVDQTMTPDVLTQWLINLWSTSSGKSTPSNFIHCAIPSANENYTVLMMKDNNAPEGTLTQEGKTELLQNLETIKRDYGVSVTLGDEENDTKDSNEYGRTVITLSRDDTHPEKLRELLKGISAVCIKQIEEAGEDNKKLLAAQIKLAMNLTQSRFFPSDNLKVGLLAINFLQLQHKQRVPYTLSNPDILDGHSLDQVLHHPRWYL